MMPTLKDVLNDALDFTKTETEAIEVESREFDLVKEIESVVQGFGSRASLKGLQLHCLIDTSLTGIWRGDGFKLMQILNNLLNNAVKFTERGSVTVTGKLLEGAVDARDSDRASWSRIALSVRDTGPGIAAADIARIFQPFGQVDKRGGAQRFAGTGLGLFICKRFVAAMGGSIDLQSTPGVGSIFTVDIALEAAPAARSPPAQPFREMQFGINAAAPYGEHLAALLAAGGGTVLSRTDHAGGRDGYLAQIDVFDAVSHERVLLDPSFSSAPMLQNRSVRLHPLWLSALPDAIAMALGHQQALTETAFPGGASRSRTDASVLIVDDQVINRLVLEKQLDYFGCRVSAAAGGKEALALTKTSPAFDLILTDLNMPGIDGYALARQWRADGIAAPIVAVTASQSAGQRERCMAAGMNGNLIKPFTMEDVEKLLELHVGLQRYAEPAATAREQAAVKALTIAGQLWQPENMRTVVASIGGDLAQLTLAVARADTDSIGKTVHRIHGGMAALDMRPAAALCRAIEESIEFEWLDEAQRLLPVLQDMLMQILQDIDPDEAA